MRGCSAARDSATSPTGGLKTHASRCSQFLYFSACRGATQYQVIVRYVKGRRSVVSLRSGVCRHGARAA